MAGNCSCMWDSTSRRRTSSEADGTGGLLSSLGGAGWAKVRVNLCFFTSVFSANVRTVLRPLPVLVGDEFVNIIFVSIS